LPLQAVRRTTGSNRGDVGYVIQKHPRGPFNLTFVIRMNWHNQILLSPGSDICQRADTVVGRPVKQKAQVSSNPLKQFAG